MAEITFEKFVTFYRNIVFDNDSLSWSDADGGGSHTVDQAATYGADESIKTYTKAHWGGAGNGDDLYYVIDFGAGNTEILNCLILYKLTSESSAQVNDVTVTVKGSPDAAAWTQIFQYTIGSANVGSEINSMKAFTNSTAYRYYRIEFDFNLTIQSNISVKFYEIFMGKENDDFFEWANYPSAYEILPDYNFIIEEALYTRHENFFDLGSHRENMRVDLSDLDGDFKDRMVAFLDHVKFDTMFYFYFIKVTGQGEWDLKPFRIPREPAYSNTELYRFDTPLSFQEWLN